MEDKYVNSVEEYLKSADQLKAQLEKGTSISSNIQCNLYFSVLDLNMILERIKIDMMNIENTTLKLELGIKKGKTFFPKEAGSLIHLFSELRVDLKSFFIFVRILLDNICKLLKEIFSSKDSKEIKLPDSINDLLFKQKFGKYKSLNPKFFEEFKNKLLWFENFREIRDKITHKLNSLYTTSPEFFNTDYFKNEDKNIEKYIIDILVKLKSLNKILN